MELKTQKLFLRFDPKIGNFTQLGNLVTGEVFQVVGSESTNTGFAPR